MTALLRHVEVDTEDEDPFGIDEVLADRDPYGMEIEPAGTAAGGTGARSDTGGEERDDGEGEKAEDAGTNTTTREGGERLVRRGGSRLRRVRAHRIGQVALRHATHARLLPSVASAHQVMRSALPRLASLFP